MNETISIIGCGGHARSIADVLIRNNPEISLVFVDNNAADNEEIFGFKVVRNHLIKTDAIVGVGDNIIRRRLYQDADCHMSIVSVVSKLAYIGRESLIGKGSFVAHGAYIGPTTNVGDNSIINTNAILEHEVRFGSHSHIAPGAIVCGRTTIGDSVMIGAGARVIDKITICSNVIIGAGATVTRSIDEPGVYVGTPAARVK